jgi:tetratricopeptide (TPR) repeat protein
MLRDRAAFRQIAEWGIQAAEALEHAHRVGIVHRDVKPANLMIDGQGALWVTDFGLARTAADAGLTMTGDVLGTLRYMSPEQAMAQHGLVDHRTDVYSLGVTLYELLTGTPAVRGRDREEILNAITLDEPPLPRSLVAALPVDLETIILKAMAKRSEERYATARKMADDLRRWLDDRPIQARRPSALHQFRKWGRRHRALVGSMAVVLLAVAAVTVTLGWMAHDRTVRREALAEVVKAALQDSTRGQEQGRLPEALSAARRAHGLLAGTDVDPALAQAVRERLADLELLDRLENIRLTKATEVKEGHFDNAGLAASSHEAMREAGFDVTALSAEEASQRVRASSVAIELAAVLDEWAMWLPDTPESRAHLLFEIARQSDPDPWRCRMREALERHDYRLLREMAASEEVLRLSPPSLLVMATYLRGGKEDRDQVERFLREAQRRHPSDFWLNTTLFDFYSSTKRGSSREQPRRTSEAVRFAAATVGLRPENAGAHFNLGIALSDAGRPEEGIAEFKEALRLKSDYAQARVAIGGELYRTGQLDAAVAEYHEALHLRKNYASAHVNIGAALARQGHLDAAIAEFREALRHEENNAQALLDLGAVLQLKGQLKEATTELRKAIQLDPESPEAHHNLGVVLLEKGRPEEATPELKKAIQLKADYGSAHNYLGNALARMGHVEEAMPEYRKAIQLNKDDYTAHYNLGILFRDKGQLTEAIAAYREAIRIRPDFPDAHCNLGHVLMAQGSFRQAAEELRLGHVLGTRNPRWPYPSARWLQQAETMAQLNGRLADILAGRAQPKDAAEQIGLAQLCQQPFKSLNAASARFYCDAFAAEPKLTDDLQTAHRYNAACAAALAGCGQGKDAARLDESERARLRSQALTWLRADLKAYRHMLEQAPDKAGQVIAPRLRHWLEDTDFAGVRGSASLARLPEPERKDWQALWQEVEALRRRAEPTPAAANATRR